MYDSDSELVSAYFSGNEQALEILINRYLTPTYRFIYRYVGTTTDAEDITQEVFVRAWRNLKKFNQSKNFKTWLFSIAKNASFDFLRKKKSFVFSDFETEEGNPVIDTLEDGVLLPDQAARAGEHALFLLRAVGRLSLKYQIIVCLHHYGEFTFREIAETLGESIDTVKSRYRRAIPILRKIVSRVNGGTSIVHQMS